MRNFTIILSALATREIEAAAAWWAERGSPTRIDGAVAKVLRQLQAFPESAPRARSRGRWSRMRHAPVDPGYRLYYRLDVERALILIERFWSTRRPPPRL